MGTIYELRGNLWPLMTRKDQNYSKLTSENDQVLPKNIPPDQSDQQGR